MSIPSGYREWCLARSINPAHPDTWAPADLDAFMAWKRAHVQARRQARIADGTWALMTDDMRAMWLRDDERMAEAPPPSNPWTRCGCHLFAPVHRPGPEPAHGLSWMAATFGRGVKG